VGTKTWKVADFGLTTEGTSTRMHTTRNSRGTTGYRAPELVKEISRYCNKVDIFALGCILFELAADGRRAFENDYVLMEYSLGRVELALPDGIVDYATRELSRLMFDMLAVNPTERASAQDLCTQFAYHRLIALANEYTSAHNHEGAIRILKEYTRDNQTKAHVWKMLGDSYKLVHKYTEAIESYRVAICAGDHEPTIHLELGDALSSIGDHSAAVDAYNFAQENGMHHCLPTGSGSKNHICMF
jgi:serine/threonine protein kinase